MSSPSGTFVLRLPVRLHRDLRELAARRGRSLNRLCAELLAAAVWPAEGSEYTVAVSDGALRGLVEESDKAFGRDLLGVVLFGSVARGEAFAHSDLDVLLVVDRRQPIRRELYSVWERTVAPFAERHFAREVTPHFAHLPESPDKAGGLWLELSIDGRVIAEREGAVSSTLRALRAYVAQGHVVRRLRHGHPYWVHRSARVREGVRR